MVRINSIPAILLLFGCLVAPVSAEPEMVVRLDRVSIYQGETFLYQIQVSDTEPIADDLSPDLSAFNDFQVQVLPKQKQILAGSTVRQIIGNRVVQDETTPTTYLIKFSYILTPTGIGSLTIPGPKFVMGSKTVEPTTLQVERQIIRNVTGGGAIPVTVHPPDQQDIAILKIEADRRQLYPFQPLTVTLVVRVKGVTGRFSGANPLTLLKNPPQLVIPWAEDDSSFSKGMVPKQNLVDWLNSQLTRSRGSGTQGFAINEHGTERFNMGLDEDWFNRPLFARSMIQKVPYQFGNSPKQIQEKDASGNEVTYWEYRFSREFRPEELGKYDFGPAMLKGALPVSDSESPEGVAARSIYAIAPAVSVEVVDVPEENRPDSYIGAFGTFDWSVELQPRKAKVGEPMTLTLRLDGQGSTVGVKPPDLSTISGVADNFRTYPPTEEVNDRSCSFTYTLRPTRTGTIEFPAIPISFFDVDKNEFITRQSDPISLEIAEAPVLRALPSPMPNRPIVGGDLELSEKGIFANMTDPSGAMDQSVDFRLWAGSLISFTATYFIFALGISVWRRLDSDPKRRRRRAAPGLARQRLNEVTTALKDRPRAGEQANALGADLQGVFFGYLADLTDGVREGMTTKDACLKLLELGVDSRIVGQVRGLLETLDGARYGGLDLRSLDDLVDTADRLLKEIVSSKASP